MSDATAAVLISLNQSVKDLTASIRELREQLEREDDKRQYGSSRG